MPSCWTGCFGGAGCGMGFGGSFMMLLFWAVIIVGFVLFFRWLNDPSKGGGGRRALDILQERYARGEIDKAEFDARKRDLA